MKGSYLSKVFSATVVAAGLAILPGTFPASAQTTTTPDNTTTTTSPGSDVYNTNTEDDFDWGWLGLLGLSGLLGLLPRKREENVRYTSTTNATDRDPIRSDYR